MTGKRADPEIQITGRVIPSKIPSNRALRCLIQSFVLSHTCAHIPYHMVSGSQPLMLMPGKSRPLKFDTVHPRQLASSHPCHRNFGFNPRTVAPPANNGPVLEAFTLHNSRGDQARCHRSTRSQYIQLWRLVRYRGQLPTAVVRDRPVQLATKGLVIGSPVHYSRH